MDDVHCTICHQIPTSPLLHTKCGYSFCKACTKTIKKCPQCNKNINHKLIPNLHLEAILNNINPCPTCHGSRLELNTCACRDQQIDMEAYKASLIERIVEKVVYTMNDELISMIAHGPIGWRDTKHRRRLRKVSRDEGDQDMLRKVSRDKGNQDMLRKVSRDKGNQDMLRKISRDKGNQDMLRQSDAIGQHEGDINEIFNSLDEIYDSIDAYKGCVDQDKQPLGYSDVVGGDMVLVLSEEVGGGGNDGFLLILDDEDKGEGEDMGMEKDRDDEKGDCVVGVNVIDEGSVCCASDSSEDEISGVDDVVRCLSVGDVVDDAEISFDSEFEAVLNDVASSVLQSDCSEEEDGEMDMVDDKIDGGKADGDDSEKEPKNNEMLGLELNQLLDDISLQLSSNNKNGKEEHTDISVSSESDKRSISYSLPNHKSNPESIINEMDIAKSNMNIKMMKRRATQQKRLLRRKKERQLSLPPNLYFKPKHNIERGLIERHPTPGEHRVKYKNRGIDKLNEINRVKDTYTRRTLQISGLM